MKRSDKKRSEVDEFSEADEFEEDGEPADTGRQHSWERDTEAPKRTPIRRKDRNRTNGFQHKQKRDDKRKNNPLKYDW